MPAPSPLLCSIGFLLAATVASAATVSLDGLVTNSPFVLEKAEVVAPAAPTEGATVEFRGMIATKDGVLFGLYDRSKNIGEWVREGDAEAEFKVTDYDAASDTVTVEYEGQRLTLAMATAQIGAASPTPLPVANTRGTVRRSGGRADDRRRLESVAAEVRRRRALRQSAGANSSGATQTRHR